MERNEDMRARLVEKDFVEESLSDSDLEADKGVELEKLRVTRRNPAAMGGFMQVVVYIMFWSLTMGVSMLALHVVARNDPNRQMVIFVGLGASWIILSNVLALIVFLINKFRVFSNQPHMSESLAQVQFMLGGVVGGWIGCCVTCYRPPSKTGSISGFICRVMICSAVGIGLIVLIIVRILVPNMEVLTSLAARP